MVKITGNNRRLTYVVLSLAVVLPFVFVQIHSNDLWKHLYSGKYLFWFGAFPHHGTFTYSPVTDFVARNTFNWLGNLVFYLLYHYSGLLGLQFFRVGIVAGLLLLLYSFTRRLTLLHFVLGILLVLSLNQKLMLRNAITSVLFFPILCYTSLQLYRNRSFEWFYAILPLVVLWRNVHGSYVIGVYVFALFTLGYLLEQLYVRDLNQVLRERFTLKLAATFVVLMAACVYLGPYPDFQLIGRAGSVASRTAQFVLTGGGSNIFLEPRAYLAHEFKSSFQYMDLLFVEITLLLSLLFPLYLYLNRISSPIILLPFIVLTLLSCLLARTTAYLSLFIVTVIFTERLKEDLRIDVEPRQHFLLLVLLCGLTWGLGLTGRVSEATGYTTQAFGPGLQTDRFSVGLPRYLRKKFPRKRFFNDRYIGSFLVFEWWPFKKVFIDGKTAAYEKPFLNRVHTQPLEQTLNEYGFNHAIVYKHSGEFLIFYRELPNWIPLGKDFASGYFRRDQST